jgi:hypothetical protein
MPMREEVITATKWASVLTHLRANRIEYLMCVAILHIVGVTNKVYSQVEGVCI